MQAVDIVVAEPDDAVPDGAGAHELQVVRGARKELELSAGLREGDAPVLELPGIGVRESHAFVRFMVFTRATDIGATPSAGARILHGLTRGDDPARLDTHR
jgi:hypothetical protein